MSCVLQGRTLISAKQRTKGPDAKVAILKDLFYDPRPAGTHADIYEVENKGFLMPVANLPYIEGDVF
jgi:hypothetical protein